MSKKVALVTGVEGQDGRILAGILADKGYDVHGLGRRVARVGHDSSRDSTVQEVYHPHYADLTDGMALSRVISSITPDEIYNLAAVAQVPASFECPEYTMNVNALGPLRILETLRNLGATRTRFFQASSSELYGGAKSKVQNEQTPFYPTSPYTVAKLSAYWMTVNYRESLSLFACNGIFFNHESPGRSTTFVTRKITKSLSEIVLGRRKLLELGNLDSERDWGHAGDYMRAAWSILQNEYPDDFVIASGEKHSVREFVETAADVLGISILWQGEGTQEYGIVDSIDSAKLEHISPGTRMGLSLGQTIVKINPEFYRKIENQTPTGDSSKARRVLGWQPLKTFQDLIEEMVAYDMDKIINASTI